MLFQQGDIVLMKVDNVPDGFVVRKSGEIVVGHGEVTGHTHTLKNANWLETAVADINKLYSFARGGGEPIYVETIDETSLTHQEHSAHTIPPGIWVVVRQRQYAPSDIKYVMD